MRTPIPTWFFVLVIVRWQDQFLLIQERKHGQRWYLPAGRVEAGETLLQAAQRETLEESGLLVTLDGIVRVEHTPMPEGGARCRVIFTAQVAGPRPTLGPTADSLGGAWIGVNDLSQYELRGTEVADYFSYLTKGGTTYPLSLLTFEGAPFS